MFKLLGQRHVKGNRETSGASVRSLIQRAVKDAEQITESIKTRAQEEAKNEAAKTLDLARQNAEEIKRSAEAAARKEAEDILSAANKKTDIAETETKQKVRSLLLKVKQELDEERREEYKQVQSRLLSSLQEVLNEGQNKVIEQSVQLKEETVTEKKEAPLPPEKEAPLLIKKEAPPSEPVRLTTERPPEQPLPEKKLDEVTPETAQLKPEDSQALFAGEIELAVAMPVELKTITRFYNYLQMKPDIKILYTRSSWDQGTTITIALEKPLPLIGVISDIPDIEVIPGPSQKDDSEKGSSLLGAKRKGVKRIRLTLKERQSSVGK